VALAVSHATACINNSEIVDEGKIQVLFCGGWAIKPVIQNEIYSVANMMPAKDVEVQKD
jgi:hypothetical protein